MQKQVRLNSRFGMVVFLKSVSGTSGKLRKNKGDDMAEESDKEIEAHRKNLQSVYWAIQGGRSFEMRTDSAHAQAIIWAINRIGQLELENENLSETSLTLSKSPPLASPESDEQIHQRRRRERMLDEITRFCVTFGFDSDDGTLKDWGHKSRGMAIEIINGINEHDAKH